MCLHVSLCGNPQVMRRGQKIHLTSTWADSCDSTEVRMHMGLDTCSNSAAMTWVGFSRVMVVTSFSSLVWRNMSCTFAFCVSFYTGAGEREPAMLNAANMEGQVVRCALAWVRFISSANGSFRATLLQATLCTRDQQTEAGSCNNTSFRRSMGSLYDSCAMEHEMWQ